MFKQSPKRADRREQPIKKKLMESSLLGMSEKVERISAKNNMQNLWTDEYLNFNLGFL